MSDAAQRFAFVQFDVAGALGPGAGRYIVRDSPEAPPSAVLVVQILGASPRSGRRRPRPSEGGPLADIPFTRLTVIQAEGLGSEDDARRWHANMGRDAATRGALVAAAAALANRALDAQRVAGRDPHVADLDPDRALAVRAGWGTGDRLAEGGFSEAIDVPPERERVRRREALAPQERVAAILGGRERVATAERMLVRARADIEAGRLAEAALELRSAEAALAAGDSPAPEDPDALRTRLSALAERLRER